MYRHWLTLILAYTTQSNVQGNTQFPGKPGGNLVARVSLYSGNRGTLTCKCRDWRLFCARKYKESSGISG